MAVSVAILLILLSGCGHSAADMPLPSSTIGMRTGIATFAIRVPRAPDRRARPRFVSPSTQSLSLTISANLGHFRTIRKVEDLTPGSPNCAVRRGALTCTLSIVLGPGAYQASVATFDGTGATGNVLSTGQNLAFVVTAGTENVEMLTLNGVPRSIGVSPLAGILGSSPSFTINGVASAGIEVTALDADGNTIVGAGAPSIKATISGKGWSSSPARPRPSNIVTIKPPGITGATATLHVTLVYDDLTCELRGAVCSAAPLAFEDVNVATQTLFVANLGSNTVTAYSPPYQTVTASFPAALPVALKVDPASGALFVANENWYKPSVSEILPPYASVEKSITDPTITGPIALAIDAHGNVIVANCSLTCLYGSATPPASNCSDATFGTVSYFTAATNYTKSQATITDAFKDCDGAPPGPPAGTLAVDAAGNTYVMARERSAVQRYASPLAHATHPIITTYGTQGSSEVFTVNPQGDVFVANAGGNMQEFDRAGALLSTAGPLSYPIAMAFDASLNMWVADENGGGSLYEFAPPYDGGPIAAIDEGNASGALPIAIDRLGDIFVGNQSGDAIYEFAPPFSNASVPIAVITAGVSTPVSIALSP